MYVGTTASIDINVAKQPKKRERARTVVATKSAKIATKTTTV